MLAVNPSEEIVTLADLLARLGGVPLERIRFRPAPGTATEQDVIDMHARDEGLYELVEGALVQKAPGFRESVLTASLLTILDAHVRAERLGLVLGPDCAVKLASGLVRMPDVSVFLWERFPGHRIPADAVPSLAPDLVVEVLSAANTRGEMERKMAEYFSAGCRCAWTVDPARLIVRVYTSPTSFKDVGERALVTGETALPGFQISVEEIFRRARV